jgi:hypothetical protein
MIQREPSAVNAPHASDIPEPLSRRVVVEQIAPEIDAGRFPIKRTIGETVDVAADVFADGHEVLVAVLRDRHARGVGSRESAAGTPQIPNPKSRPTGARRR